MCSQNYSHEQHAALLDKTKVAHVDEARNFVVLQGRDIVEKVLAMKANKKLNQAGRSDEKPFAAVDNSSGEQDEQVLTQTKLHIGTTPLGGAAAQAPNNSSLLD